VRPAAAGSPRGRIDRLWRLGLHIAKLIALSGGLLLFSQAFLPRLLSDPPGEIHARLCGELDLAMRGGQRLVGALPREHAKTTLGTVALVLREVVLGSAGCCAWQQATMPADSKGSAGVTPAVPDRQQGSALLEQRLIDVGATPTLPRDSKQNILIIGANAQEARVKLRQVVTELESNPLLRAAFGKLCAPARDKRGQPVAYTDGEIVLAGGARISTLGFGGKVRGQLSGGRRLDLVILDDPEDDRSVENPELRQRLRRWVDTALLNALDVRQGSLVWLGTLLHHDSVLAQLLAERNPVAAGPRPADEEPAGGGPAATAAFPWRSLSFAALDDNNTPLWPGRWSFETLMRRKAEIGSRAFAQEYLNQPQSLEEQIFLDTQWQCYDPAALLLNDGSWELNGRSMRTVIGVDPAIGEDRRHDFFAAAVIGVLPARGAEPPRAAVLELQRHRWPFARQLASLRELAARWLPGAIGIESVAYQAALKQSAFELGLPALELKGVQSKAARIETLAALVESGRLLLPVHGPWVARLREEAVQYPSGRHDDQLDALARAVETAGLLSSGGEALPGVQRRGRTRGF
jgi:predicted phage terminase large subunit-like protein